MGREPEKSVDPATLCARRWMKEDTERAVREGRADPAMLRTVGPGPWDDDEAFWSDPYDSDETPSWEFEEDVFIPG